VNNEDRISPWANYVLQPPREKQDFEGKILIKSFGSLLYEFSAKTLKG